jgi:hypothetical protein
MFGGNVVAKRFVLNNLVIASIGAVSTVAVAVPVAAAAGLVVGQVGFAVPNAAAFTAGLPAIVGARVTTATEITLYFANGSAGAIDPADTFEFTVFIFENTGDVQQTI